MEKRSAKMTRKTQSEKPMTGEEMDEMCGLIESKEIKSETKNRRTALLIKPSLYSDMEKLAFVKKTSVNDLFNIIAEEYTANNKELIEKYDDIMRQLEEIRGK